MKKCTGEVDDIDDIAKNVKIAMQIFISRMTSGGMKEESGYNSGAKEPK